MWLLANWRIAAVASMCIAGFAVGWYFRSLQCDAVLADIQRKAIVAVEEKNQASLKAAVEAQKEIERVRLEGRKRKQGVSNEISKPDYRAVIPAGGVQQYRNALGSYRTSQSDSPMSHVAGLYR